MVGPYRGLFSAPGVKGFVVAGFVGRMPMSMLGIGVILLIQNLTGSYALAGAVAATFNVSFAVAGPVSARLVDRFGQARVIVPLVLMHGAALTAMMLCARFGTPRWVLFATGVAAGATAISLGSLVRARWSHLLTGSPRLHAAFSFESVADEVIFVTGPALVTVLATLINPYAGLIVALTCTIGAPSPSPCSAAPNHRSGTASDARAARSPSRGWPCCPAPSWRWARCSARWI